ncbi:hypothetical protein ONZ45_g8684 [Pleurotus djamor]|nr:hypothetical protein ONZ45_g8684 [Pleurotus djamor]
MSAEQASVPQPVIAPNESNPVGVEEMPPYSEQAAPSHETSAMPTKTTDVETPKATKKSVISTIRQKLLKLFRK